MKKVLIVCANYYPKYITLKKCNRFLKILKKEN